MPENKICKSSILNYTGYSKVPSTLLGETKLIFTYLLLCLQLIFFMPFQEYLIQKERYAFKMYLLKIK